MLCFYVFSVLPVSLVTGCLSFYSHFNSDICNFTKFVSSTARGHTVCLTISLHIVTHQWSLEICIFATDYKSKLLFGGSVHFEEHILCNKMFSGEDIICAISFYRKAQRLQNVWICWPRHHTSRMSNPNLPLVLQFVLGL